jgi:hypothetical protein
MAAKVKSVGKLYGRCLELAVGDVVIEVKVMGDKGPAAAQRDTLIAALAAMGVTVVAETKGKKEAA